MAAKRHPHQQASDKRKANGSTWRKGQSGNARGRKLGGKPASEAIKRLAREFSEECFLIVQEIARTGADEGERLRAARLCLDIANAEDDKEAAADNTITVRYVDDYQASTGDDTGKPMRPVMNIDYHELGRQKALAEALGTTLEEVQRIEREAADKRKRIGMGG